MKKLIYIAHPIGGDVENNVRIVKELYKNILMMLPDVVPVCHYIIDCEVLDDNNPAERARGIENDTAILKSGMIKEIWLYGNRISKGMHEEIKLAHEMKIAVIPMTDETSEEYYFMLKHGVRPMTAEEEMKQ